MFSKLKKSANPASRFYEVPANTEVVRCGYMYKSPSQNLLSRSLKSWKRRFFVLSKMPINHYELKFFKDESRREKPLGQIQLYQVSLFFRHADSHPIWPWIQRNFRCSASCVLYMRVQEREYFLIGENSCEMDSWFDAIFKALNTPCASQPDSEDIRNRSMSEPLNVLHHDQKEPGDQEQNETDPKPSSFSRQSAPTFINMQRSHYDYPKNYMMTSQSLTSSQSLESEDTDDDEEDETINKDSEAEEDNSYYMDMESVREVIKQTQQEDVLFPQTNETFVPVEKEICVSQDELKNSVIFSEETGKLCVSRWRYTQSSAPFHVGDQILAINDLLTDSLVELQSYLKRLSKDQVKLTILRQPGSQPLSACYT
ncbi:pleckstrin homology domain-containing family S member 1-like isoform X3 [Neoarius graeffei]|uniref:pleckstrin homology domain-containing family S member 1-like isoform X3 n=1 Tax=Neoarius graeffei TaxID=443677 RepID=UPI00298CE45D|nr:pleckstrin homology domain-containing family S member 1-like isoform X3 [Neoarius graeffei]